MIESVEDLVVHAKEELDATALLDAFGQDDGQPGRWDNHAWSNGDCVEYAKQPIGIQR